MGYRTFVSMKVALIGTGEIAERFALQYAAANGKALENDQTRNGF